jgi:peroxiredoxin Q/BCP
MKEAGIEVGQVAPEFALPDQNDVRVALSELRGQWVVLYFYPKDDTPGCTTESCEFTEGIEAFRDLDAVVLGCSPDPPERHRKFIAKHGLEVRLLSDPEHEVMETYGAWGEKVLYGRTSVGVIRSTVLIDPKGRIAHHWKRVKSKGHAGKVRERLESILSS